MGVVFLAMMVLEKLVQLVETVVVHERVDHDLVQVMLNGDLVLIQRPDVLHKHCHRQLT